MKGNYKKAKAHLTIAVKNMPYKIQARSELVLTLFTLNQYSEAESLAFENYKLHKNNPYYIQAYFKCLINRSTRGAFEIQLLKDLIEKMSHNPHPRANDMKLVMEAQFDYYVNGFSEKAKNKLKRSISSSQNKRNAYNELYKILQEENDYSGMNDLSQLYNINELDDIED